MEGKNANDTAISKNLLKLNSLSDIRWHVMTRLQELRMMAVNWHNVSSPCIKLKIHLSMNTSKSAIDSWLFSSVSVKVWNTKRFQCVTMCHSNCVICHSPSDLLSSSTCLLACTATAVKMYRLSVHQLFLGTDAHCAMHTVLEYYSQLWQAVVFPL